MGKKNLLQNPCAKDGLHHWEVIQSGGDGFKCEDEPSGCKKLSECCKIKHELPCWCTSHDPCLKKQVVNLLSGDVDPKALDERKRPITVRDWYCSRGDCGAEYEIKASLLADDRTTVLDSWAFKDKLEAGADWKKVKHVFKDYPAGVRYVEFVHGGTDTQNWAGHFGVKMTNSAVLIGQKIKKREKRSLKAAGKKNLLKNPCGRDGMAGWEVTENGGNGWKAEDSAEGCRPFKEANPEAEGDACWATSFDMCMKKQRIDLGFAGIVGDYLDDQRPEIRVSEWCGSRTDAGSEYHLLVRLLNSDLETVDKREVTKTLQADGQWHKIEESFIDYGPGVRFIEYSHGGKDSCFWQGHFGVKITCSSVTVATESGHDSSSSDDH
ncbi:uncharacterized protein LOC127875003 [Dreissena polymorpha]|uniref:FBA domain-containing protein n=1 Tax=Dreissena polymorpha TaxID=45954 RepID=A0A9D4L6Y1_DREPO|nr:uncharacterized protein LOC127875003 [Dreissena polymorpha]KAH3852394.1 hypothetical protein DPMN_094901 [Dreissena polymorpha]